MTDRAVWVPRVGAELIGFGFAFFTIGFEGGEKLSERDFWRRRGGELDGLGRWGEGSGVGFGCEGGEYGR